MTPTTLAADAAQALQGVTEGKWTAMLHDDGMMAEIVRFGDDFTTIADAYEDADACFIAFARAWVPEAAAALAALSEQNTALAAQVAELVAKYDALGRLLEQTEIRAEAAEAKVAELTRERDATREALMIHGAARHAAEAKVARFSEALIWCSAASDFAEGGIAREGWLKLCAPLIAPNTDDAELLQVIVADQIAALTEGTPE